MLVIWFVCNGHWNENSMKYSKLDLKYEKAKIYNYNCCEMKAVALNDIIFKRNLTTKLVNNLVFAVNYHAHFTVRWDCDTNTGTDIISMANIVNMNFVCV